MNFIINIDGEKTYDDLDNGYDTPSLDSIEMDKNMPLDNKDKDCYNATQVANSDKDGKDDAPQKERTRVVYGEDETTKVILQTVNNARRRWDNYADSNGPTIAMGIEQLRKGMRNAHRRGGQNKVHLRYYKAQHQLL